MAKKSTYEKMPLKSKLIILLVFTIIVISATVMVMNSIYKSREPAAPEINAQILGEKIASISELSTVKYIYTNAGKYERQNTLWGHNVPLTKSSFIVAYSGVIKAGINLKDAEITVTDTEVIIDLPVPEITSHVIDLDSVEVFDETRNIFNPLKIDDYNEFYRSEKEKAETDAIANGIYKEAVEGAETALRSFLSNLPEVKENNMVLKFI